MGDDPDGPDVDPVTGDEAATEPPRFTLEVHDSVLGHDTGD